MTGEKSDLLTTAEGLDTDAGPFRKEYGRKGPVAGTVQLFRRIVYRHCRHKRKGLPWRQTRDPYRILVSEFMLQQTQVERVRRIYDPFIESFPDFDSLARAELAEVLGMWQGLGYNRRAMALHRTAKVVMSEWSGKLPADAARLQSLPGVGLSTAGAVVAFAFNGPAVFIETNIRRLYLHFFFAECDGVRDGEILPLVAKTLDRRRPREWYYALMDGGSAIKALGGNANRRSAHFKRQSSFEGSDRQVRSRIIRRLLAEAPLDEGRLLEELEVEERRGRNIVEALLGEGFILRRRGKLTIA